MNPTVEKVVENCSFLEGPHWDEETQSLHFVDMKEQYIYRYVPSTQQTTKASIGAHVSIIIPIKGSKNTFLITSENKLLFIKWDGEGEHFSVLKTIDIGNEKKLNDGKCDPTGRLWIGSLDWAPGSESRGNGSLYTLQNGKSTKVENKIAISNGIAFNTELNKMYFIDSRTKTVDEFDVDITNGTIKNRHPIFTLSKHNIPGEPDGMTIDSDGNLWVAIINGGRVIKIDPRKLDTLLYTLPLPPKQVTSVAFGGKNLDELYITTGYLQFGDREKLKPPEHGAIYRVTGLGVKGLPAEKFVL